jgi:hypothetical protein
MKTLFLTFILALFAQTLSAQIYYSSEWTNNEGEYGFTNCIHFIENGYYRRTVFNSEGLMLRKVNFKIAKIEKNVFYLQYDITQYDGIISVTIYDDYIKETFSSGYIQFFKTTKRI